jgi:hypothetical protein
LLPAGWIDPTERQEGNMRACRLGAWVGSQAPECFGTWAHTNTLVDKYARHLDFSGLLPCVSYSSFLRLVHQFLPAHTPERCKVFDDAGEGI